MDDFSDNAMTESSSLLHAMSNTSTKYNQEQLAGYIAQARLDRALHALQDSYAPGHIGLQVYDVKMSWKQWLEHILTDSYAGSARERLMIQKSADLIKRRQCSR